ncbi:hypothetical protein D3C71_1481910 [compost metagenome]
MQRDDGRSRRTGVGQFARSGFGGAAFDAQQDDAVRARRRVGQCVCQLQLRHGHGAVKAIQVRDFEAVQRDGLQRMRTAHQADRLAVRGQAPTHITTNGACAENDEVHADAFWINGRRCTAMEAAPAHCAATRLPGLAQRRRYLQAPAACIF